MANDFDIDSLDPETLAELRRLSRREQMANELYGRSNQPLQGQMVGGIYVKPSPLQGIANLAGAYMSGRERNAIDEGYKALGEKSAANKTAAWQRMSEAIAGKPEEQLPPNVFGPPRPAVEGSMERALQVGMESPYTRESAKAIALEMMKQKMKGIEPYTLGPGQVRFGPDGRQMAAVPNKPDNQPTSIDEYNFAKGQGYTGSFQDWMKDKAQAIHVNTGGNPYFNYISTPQGIVKLDTRGMNKPEIVSIDGGKIQKSEQDISHQGALAAAKKEGADLGEQRATIVGKENALESVKEAGKLLDKGIYTGLYAPAAKMAVKAIPGMDTSKAARTEEFISHIGNVVIPRLKEFGGNDSNEELRYLQKVMGGDISMEDAALKKMVKDAETKIQRGIDRLRSGKTAMDTSPDKEIGTPPDKGIVREVRLKDGRIGVEYSDGTRGFK